MGHNFYVPRICLQIKK